VSALRVRRRGVSSQDKNPKRILLTGTFYSQNWILNHLRPLAASDHCAKVWLVTTFAIAPVKNVEVVAPPSWLMRSLGEVPARLIVFTALAIRHRPDFVGGFHLLPNGLLAILLARLIGRASVYFCGGGPREVEGGGFYSGARSMRLLKAPDDALETKLLRAISEFDLVITMGGSARDFFRSRGARNRIEVVPGGIDAASFQPVEGPKLYDLILVGRLHRVKRIDLFLRVVSLLAQTRADVSAVVVGGGELEETLKQLAVRLRVDGLVTFAGPQHDVASWLARSRVFVLTSESEGLSLALMEAMTAGLPCVVSNVGELKELVQHGSTGFLIDDGSPDTFCFFLSRLLESESVRRQFSDACRRVASQLTVAQTAQRWDRVLRDAL